MKMKTGNIKGGLTNQPPLEADTETNDIWERGEIKQVND
jgi:hypothetical protein